MRQLLSSKRVFTEISSLLRGSNSWQRGRSYAASVPSCTPKDKKPQTRLSKPDRKILVEAFVDRYKASNSGKFPSVIDVYKEVGGGYYVIRQIVQEIEYEAKHPSIKTSKTPSSGEKAKKSMSVTEVEEVLVKEGTMSEEAETVNFGNTESFDIQMPKVTPVSGEIPSSTEIVKETIAATEVDGVLLKKEKISIEAEKVIVDNTESLHIQMPEVTVFKASEDLSTHSGTGTEEILKDSWDKSQESDEKNKPNENVDIHPATPKIDSNDHQQHPESERRDVSSVKAENVEVQKKSSMWGSLKSMAGGLITMIKNL
jgi:hypothetical protein